MTFLSAIAMLLLQCALGDFNQCSVAEHARKDCGYYGITEQGCMSRGCCWKVPSQPREPMCFFKSGAPGPSQCTPSARYEVGKINMVDLEVGDQHRKVLLYIPKSRGAGSRGPGLVSFHGLHANPWADVVHYMNQTAYAEKYGYSLAIPFGTSWVDPSPICCPHGWNAEQCSSKRPVEFSFDWANACGWNSGLYHPRSCLGIPGCHTPKQPSILKDPVGHVNDVDMAKAAALLLAKEACVDENNVFALGFSAGSMMSNRVACDAGDTFRGVVAISGFLDPLVGLECALKKQRPMNYITYCGMKDARCMALVSPTWKMWGKKNNCSQNVTATVTTQTTWCSAFTGCADDVIVERCLILGMDDQVPGHNRTWFFGLQPFQPTTNIDSIDYSFKRFANLPSPSGLRVQTNNISADETTLPVMV